MLTLAHFKKLFQTNLLPQVVDAIFEEIRLGMEVNDSRMNQRRLATAYFLAEVCFLVLNLLSSFYFVQNSWFTSQYLTSSQLCADVRVATHQ